MAMPSKPQDRAAPDEFGQHALGSMYRRLLELARQSGIDPLTGLWTRRHFDRTVGREIALSESQHSPLSLVLIGPDHMREPGVQPWQPSAEAGLRAMAERLRTACRPTDVLFRWNAAGFALLAPATSAATGRSLAARLRAILSNQAFPVFGRIAVSAGVGEHISGEGPEPWIGRVTAARRAARRRPWAPRRTNPRCGWCGRPSW